MIAKRVSVIRPYGVTSPATGVVGRHSKLLVQIPVLLQRALLSAVTGVSHPALQKCKAQSLGHVATAVVPVNAFVDRAMASGLQAGSISACLCFRVFMPVSLFAAPYTGAATTSAAHHRVDKRRLRSAGAGLSLYLVLPYRRQRRYWRWRHRSPGSCRQKWEFTLMSLTIATWLLPSGHWRMALVVMVRLFNAVKDPAPRR